VSKKPWFDVPDALRTWFVIHFVVDLVVGVPLLIAPAAVLGAFGWSPLDPGATRLVAAALLAIGLSSYRVRGEGIEVFRAFLSLKIIWSLLAIFALFAAIGGGAPSVAWVFLFTFLIFLGVWTHYAIVFRRLLSAGPEAFSYGDPDAASEPDQTRPASSPSTRDSVL